MHRQLEGKKIAILVAKGFEEVELTEPKRALEEAGAETFIVSPEEGKVRAWNFEDWGQELQVDIRLADADAREFDALVLPGGVMNPDQLRVNERALDFVRGFFGAGKPVAAICHAPWTLIDAGVVEGRQMTSYPSVRTDLRNAGAEWVDEAAVVDNGLITSRDPGDLPAFCRTAIQEFEHAAPSRRKAVRT